MYFIESYNYNIVPSEFFNKNSIGASNEREISNRRKLWKPLNIIAMVSTSYGSSHVLLFIR